MSKKSLKLCKEKKTYLENQIKKIETEIARKKRQGGSPTIKTMEKMIIDRKKIIQACKDHIAYEKLREAGN